MQAGGLFPLPVIITTVAQGTRSPVEWESVAPFTEKGDVDQKHDNITQPQAKQDYRRKQLAHGNKDI